MDKIIRENEGLIYEAIKQYYPQLKITDDIIQLGRIGIWKAAKTYDETKGSFAHHAVLRVRYEIGVHFRDQAYEKRAMNDKAAHLEEPVIGLDNKTLGDTIEAKPHSRFVDWTGIEKALTPREFEILGYMMSGYTGEEIARAFNISRARVYQLTDKIKKIVKEYV